MVRNEADDTKVTGGVKLPFVEAFRISFEQIQRRIRRSSIVIGAIALGIALMTHFLVTNLIFEAYGKPTGIKVEAYQLWLVVVSIVVCVIGLTNSSLIAVYERYREIGIMKSLGALDRHVLELFLIESTIYGLIGGILGFIAGTISAIISTSLQIGFDALSNVGALDLLLHFNYSVGLAVVLNTVSTVYPAYKAARLRPVEALGYEI